MRQQNTFRWHETAALYAGPVQIARSTTGLPTGFLNITGPELTDVLGAFAEAVVAGVGFCVSETTLPKDITTQAGDFFTLTGGSSGTPKVICRTQLSWIKSFEVNQKLFGFQPGKSVGTLGVLSHSLSLYAVLEALYLGMRAHVLAGQKPAAQRATLKQHEVETLYVTPTQLRLLTSGHSDMALPDIRHILCGGGALDEATQSAAHHLCPNAALHQFYGAAETSFVTMTDAQTPAGSVGKPYPDVELLIEEDEVWARSPYLFSHYAMGGSDGVRRADGFVSVGEIGRMDGDGNLWLKGRKTRMINIADQCVYPEEIESLILEQAGVTGCAVLPEPDVVRGQRLVIVLNGSEDLVLAARIKDICSNTFGPLIAPRKVLFHPALPQLASGKTDLTALAQWLETKT